VHLGDHVDVINQVDVVSGTRFVVVGCRGYRSALDGGRRR
jgi:hypothetical protein